MRKIISLFTMFALVFVFAFTPVMAMEKEPDASVMVLQSGACTLTISGLTAKSSVSVSANNTDSISVTLHLQKLKDGTWTSVKTKSGSTTNDSYSDTMTKLITAGSFRTKAVVTVKDGSTTETKTYYSSVKVKE